MTVYSNLKYDHPFSSNATGLGALTKISSQTASSSSSLSFTSGIDSTYKEYIFKFINVHPATGAGLQFNGSIDGGSNYNVTKTTTFFRAYHNEADDGAAVSYATGGDLAQSTNFQGLMGTLGTNNDDSGCGTLHLFDPSNTTFVKHFISNTNIVESGPASYNTYVGGYMNTTSAVNAVQFKMSSGNIDSGTIIMYGVS
jgi:hypothetical protein